MHKNHLFTTLFVSLFIALIAYAKPANKQAAAVASAAFVNDSAIAADAAAKVSLSTSLYEGLHLAEAGLSKEALDYAVKGYEKLLAQGAVPNDQYLTIVDLSQSSRKKRFYLLDVKNNKLVVNTFVSHGKNSGVDMAQHFSNNPNSNQSSLGFYITGVTYTGKHGISLRLSGQEEGFNNNAERRGVVVHGAPYVNAGRVNSAYMGRSQGCPALPEGEFASVINTIKNGTVLFVYHPSADYIQHSSLLNS